MEEENTKIKGELESWNQYYNQEETSPEAPISTPMSSAISVPEGSSLFHFTSPMQMTPPEFPMGIPTSQLLLGPSAMMSTPAVSLPSESSGWVELTPENIR